ncbi:MAG TPA: hypothetical protein VKC54_01650 [Patescibacteria group bacterium]|nr:hypothetical protein [Patescibacteria group bacterium]
MVESDHQKSRGWEKVGENYYLQLLHVDRRFPNFVSSQVYDHKPEISELFPNFLGSIGDARIRSLNIFRNDSTIGIQAKVSIESIQIGIKEQKAVDFIEISFVSNGERGKDKFFFDDDKKFSFFHSGAFWPLKGYSIKDTKVLKLFEEFSEIDMNFVDQLKKTLEKVQSKGKKG